jgi:hypothetical protein
MSTLEEGHATTSREEDTMADQLKEMKEKFSKFNELMEMMLLNNANGENSMGYQEGRDESREYRRVKPRRNEEEGGHTPTRTSESRYKTAAGDKDKLTIISDSEAESENKEDDDESESDDESDTDDFLELSQLEARHVTQYEKEALRWILKHGTSLKRLRRYVKARFAFIKAVSQLGTEAAKDIFTEDVVDKKLETRVAKIAKKQWRRAQIQGKYNTFRESAQSSRGSYGNTNGRQPMNPARLATMRCDNCNNVGHLWRQCPSPLNPYLASRNRAQSSTPYSGNPVAAANISASVPGARGN